MKWSLAWVCCCVVLVGCAAGPTRPPLYISGDGPVYPTHAKTQRIEGFVRLEYAVSVEGSVENVKVLEAEPPGVFDDAAVEAVSRWRYKPLVIKGEVQRAERVETIVRFQIGEPERYEDY